MIKTSAKQRFVAADQRDAGQEELCIRFLLWKMTAR